ncbi:MAG: oligosaccharide flippase family protein [Pseudomonadota bacterium]|nr:oligosaccharide flippase family protein [Pseudomonadota bacterium]
MNKYLSSLKAKLSGGPFKEGRFVTNVATIIAGTLFSQIIALLAMPILARIYSPEDFGVLATFVMLANNLAMLACLQYQGAIILPKRKETAFVIWIGCLCLTTIIALLCGLIFLFFDDAIAKWLSSPRLENWLWLVPISIFAWGGFEASAIWNTRLKKFKNISIATVQRRLGMSGLQLSLGGVAGSEVGLITGQVTGEILGFATLGSRGMKHAPQKGWKYFNWRMLKILVYRYRRFPQFTLFSSFASALARNMPVLCLGIYFNPAIVGFFALAYKGLVGPLQIGVTSITRVFFERANRAKIAGNLSELTLKAYQRLVIVTLTPLIMVAMVAPDITVFILGKDWYQTGIYIRWLCFWVFFMATASPLHRLFVILERQNELAVINGLLFLFSTTALIIGGESGDSVFTIAIYSMAASVIWLGQGARILFIAGVNLKGAIKVIFHELLKSLPYLLGLAAAVQLTSNIYIRTLIFVILMAIFGLNRIKEVIQK